MILCRNHGKAIQGGPDRRHGDAERPDAHLPHADGGRVQGRCDRNAGAGQRRETPLRSGEVFERPATPASRRTHAQDRRFLQEQQGTILNKSVIGFLLCILA